MRRVTSTKTDERVEIKEEFEQGLYHSRSRIVQAEGGTNPDKEDIAAGDEHILMCVRKGGRWLTLPPAVPAHVLVVARKERDIRMLLGVTAVSVVRVFMLLLLLTASASVFNAVVLLLPFCCCCV